MVSVLQTTPLNLHPQTVHMYVDFSHATARNLFYASIAHK